MKAIKDTWTERRGIMALGLAGDLQEAVGEEYKWEMPGQKAWSLSDRKQDRYSQTRQDSVVLAEP